MSIGEGKDSLSLPIPSHVDYVVYIPLAAYTSMIQCVMITNESLCIHFSSKFSHFKTGCFLYTSVVNLTPVCFLIYGNKYLPRFFFQVPLNNNTLFHVFLWMLLSHSDAHSQRPPTCAQDCLLILFLLR